jgi:hypothetical protein
VDLALFTGPNDNANAGRRNALANRANAAANEVADGNYAEAMDVLISLLDRVDGTEPPPDWMEDSAEKSEIVARIGELTTLVGFLVP